MDPIESKNYDFDGSISREVLENYLSRAVTFYELLDGHGDLEDHIRLIGNIGAKFLGRSVFLWGEEDHLEALLELAAPAEQRMHELDASVGTTPSGWDCEHSPYLVEFDNFGASGDEGQDIGGPWIWGYDEISWFANQEESYRNQWLRYAWDWIRINDPNGYLQMPVSRGLAAPASGKDWYYAHMPSQETPDGFNQEETIKSIWRQYSHTGHGKPIGKTWA